MPWTSRAPLNDNQSRHHLIETGSAAIERVKISIDDFGTGFSSLAYFRDLPVNELKIDKSFVLKMLASEKDLIIVKAVIELAHNFSLSVVAEGVETQAAVNKLNELNCDQLQGYYFDRPLVASDFEKRYLNN